MHIITNAAFCANYDNYDTTLFIGRILNGKRINIEENINLKIK